MMPKWLERLPENLEYVTEIVVDWVTIGLVWLCVIGIPVAIILDLIGVI